MNFSCSVTIRIVACSSGKTKNLMCKLCFVYTREETVPVGFIQGVN